MRDRDARSRVGFEGSVTFRIVLSDTDQNGGHCDTVKECVGELEVYR